MNFFYFLNNLFLKTNYTCSIISLILSSFVFYLVFSYFFKTTENKKYLKYLFIFLNTCVFSVSIIFLNSIFSQAVIIFFTTLSFAIIFKESFTKIFLYSIIFTIILLNLEILILRPVSYFLNSNYTNLIKIPIFILALLFCYFIDLFITYFISKKLKINTIEFTKNFKITAEVFTIYLIDLFLAFQLLDICFNYITTNNYYILLFLFIIINFYYCISISNILKTFKLEANNQKILNLELYNQSISAAYDETRTFKHDSNNIFQAIGGYISNNNMEGLKEYYNQLFPEIKNINNLSKLNPSLVNNPAIYGLLVEKHFKASNYNVDINLDILLDLNTLNVKIFEFTRILGILVDNAIETAKDCSEKIVNICFKKQNNKQLLIVENTYANKEVCIDKIFEKGFSTKPNNTGLGLWEVRKILNKNSNLNLYTSKNNNFFMQQLEIY